MGLRATSEDVLQIYSGFKKIKKGLEIANDAKNISCDIKNLQNDLAEKKRVENSIRNLTDPSADAMGILEDFHNQQMNAVEHAGDLAGHGYEAGSRLQRMFIK